MTADPAADLADWLDDAVGLSPDAARTLYVLAAGSLLIRGDDVVELVDAGYAAVVRYGGAPWSPSMLQGVVITEAGLAYLRRRGLL